MKKLAIVGFSKNWEFAPWNDRAYDCWTLNSAWQHVLHDGEAPSRLAAWFELHSRRYLNEEWMGRKAHVNGLRLLRVPIYVQNPKEWPELSTVVAFPRAQIAKRFPRGDYHASSLDWMLAYGLFRGYRDIDLWGVNFGPTDGGEPLSARACLEYWIGLAEGRGVTVTVHDPTGLFWIYNITKEKTPYHFDDTWRLIEPR